MTAIPQNLQAWIEDHPETRQPGRPEHEQAKALHGLAYAKGFDPGDANYMRLLEDHLGASRGGSMRLTAAEAEIARVSGITPEEYAANKREAERQGVIGRNSRGY